MKPQDIIKEKSSLWIFGYGSLVWKPNFTYKRSKIGHIVGYKRRFWHGDDFYRGDKEKVRFVATYFSFKYFPGGWMMILVCLCIHFIVHILLCWCEMCVFLSTARQSGYTSGGSGGKSFLLLLTPKLVEPVLNVTIKKVNFMVLYNIYANCYIYWCWVTFTLVTTSHHNINIHIKWMWMIIQVYLWN